MSGAKTLPRGLSLCARMGTGMATTLGTSTSLDSGADSGSSPEASRSEVYGLYADLMNVQDYESHEQLNRSDPELMHFHFATLGRRSHRPGRPRSWDLSTMEVSGDSDSSAATCDAHNVANNMAAVVANSGNVAVVGGQAPSHLPGTSSSASEMVPKSSFASSPSPSLSSVEGPPYGTLRQPRKGPLGTAQLRGTVEGGHGTCPQQQQQQCKTLLTITGGCGYVNWRKAGVERDYGSTAASPSGDALVLIWEMKV